MSAALCDCAALLRERDDILLVTHKRPDGDTLGSAAALCHALRRLGKRAALYPNPDISELFTPFTAPYLAPADFAWTTAVSLDVAEASLLAPGFRGELALAIDHHPGESVFAAQMLRDSRRSACGELVLELIDALCGAPDREEATLLYMAVSTDTGCFRYGNTNADTFRAAARLTDAGADLSLINKVFFRTKSRARLKLESEVYSSLLSYRDGALNIAVVSLEMLRRSGVSEGDLEDLAGLAGCVAGGRVSVTVRETAPGQSKISVRTDGSVNATAVCARFGGGGHRMASGCELPLAPLDAAEAVRRTVEELWP